jgi:GntR family transcriptional regulator, rspAB operon transcriptional repressor
MSTLLSDKAYELIKEKIKNYEGNNISVRKIAKEIDIGYSPAREACNRLAQEGLMEIIPGIGYYVPKVKEKILDEIFEFREVVEIYVFNSIFDLINQRHIDMLSKYIENQVNFLKKKDIKSFHQYDKKFHLFFFKLHNNSVFTNQMSNIMDRSYFCSHKTVDSMEKNKNIDAVEEHKDIVKCIAAHDKENAIKKFREHIQNNEKRFKEGFYYKLEKSLLL